MTLQPVISPRSASFSPALTAEVVRVRRIVVGPAHRAPDPHFAGRELRLAVGPALRAGLRLVTPNSTADGADDADGCTTGAKRIRDNPCHPRSKISTRAFTLVEILASLLLMAIIVPVAMHGMSIASRAGMMGQRKAAAMRVAERVLNELIVTGQTTQSSNSGTAVDGNTAYPWTLESETWTEDAMLQLTVRVTFTVQGNEYNVSTSTLVDPLAPPPTALPEEVP